MSGLDWAVILVYAALLIGLARSVGRSQRNVRDYYLAGRKIRWWESGTSTMATQLGAISLVSAPAFVALKEGGGLKWLCYELGVPLALVLVMSLIMPRLHRGGFVSIYEYLEGRFDRGTRALVSLFFQIGRGLATAVSVLAGGLIVSTATGIPTALSIVLIGAVTIAYDVMGGIRMVVVSDVLQMSIILLGIVLCGAVALELVGWRAAWEALGADRSRILDFRHWGLSAEGAYAFWPMVLGGFFLYASYYGCDQSQVQREMSVESVGGARRSLLLNAVGRFPLVLLYVVMGVFIGAAFSSPEGVARVAATMGTDEAGVRSTLGQDPDRMVPMFILAFLPHGLIGFLFVAILSALMSSLDSAINSLSASTLRDFYQVYVRTEGTEGHYLKVSKLLSAFWGTFCVVAALGFAGFGEATRQTTIVLINAVGSVLYGPILAVFVLGMAAPWATARGVKPAFVAGIAANLLLWRLTAISWLWWNLAGFVVVVLVALGLRWSSPRDRAAAGREEVGARDRTAPGWGPVYGLVVAYFFVIVFACYLLEASLA